MRFGLVIGCSARRVDDALELALRPGSITLIVGPSGSGKTCLLQNIVRQHPLSRQVQGCPFPTDVCVIDAVAPTLEVAEAMKLLTCCGLGEPKLWIRSFDQLSEGERFRARLARALSLHRSDAVGGGHLSKVASLSEAPLLCDEFGSGLHRQIAQSIAFNLRRLVSRERLAMVIATCRDDVEVDLQPDVIVRIAGLEQIMRTETRGLRRRHREPSFTRDMRVERGSLKDYAKFAPMHYRDGGRVGFVDKVFALRSRDGETFGAVVYGHAALELQLRNRATGGRFVKNSDLLNDELRVLKRLVVHPDIRGCGLAQRLVRESLPRVKVRFVECLAAMGLVNPVFEKAGMQRIGVCELPKHRELVMRKLREWHVDPFSADFEMAVLERADVRELIAHEVEEWYRGLHHGGPARVERQNAQTLARTFRQLAWSQPVYYLWAGDQEGQELMENSMTG